MFELLHRKTYITREIIKKIKSYNSVINRSTAIIITITITITIIIMTINRIVIM